MFLNGSQEQTEPASIRELISVALIDTLPVSHRYFGSNTDLR